MDSRTILWCVPRSISSALTKCLSAIDNMEVWFEPYNLCHAARAQLKFHLDLDLPPDYEGHEDAYRKAADLLDGITSGRTNPEWLSYRSTKQLLETSSSRHVFVKDMGFALAGEEYRFLPSGYRHVFLIRHPLKAFKSYRRSMFHHFTRHKDSEGEVVDEQMFDLQRHNQFMTSGLCYKELYDLWQYVRENIDSHPIVLDGDDLLANPAELLPKFCQALGLPYDKSLLHWDASPGSLLKCKCAVEDFLVNLVDFHEAALKSSKFSLPGPMPSRDELTPDVIRCSDQVMRYYDEMYANRLK